MTINVKLIEGDLIRILLLYYVKKIFLSTSRSLISNVQFGYTYIYKTSVRKIVKSIYNKKWRSIWIQFVTKINLVLMNEYIYSCIFMLAILEYY